MRRILSSIEDEYRRYKALGDRAISQLSEAELAAPGPGGGNSVAVVAWHIAGNLRSRFTDFLTADGEKPWRMRETEFAPRAPTRDDLSKHWEGGWATLFTALSELTDEHLDRVVTIRGVALGVHAALHRSLAHVSYHVGQIVYLAKAMRGPQWEWLSVPPGGSDAYNRNPTLEHARAHAATLRDTVSEASGVGEEGDCADE